MKKGVGLSNRSAEILYDLDSYSDIFSDFDPRPSSQRSISEDFIAEARKVILNHKDAKRITVRMFLPRKYRNIAEEKKIIARLKNHFSMHYNILKERSKSELRDGIKFSLVGVIFMLMATYIVHYVELKSFLLTFLIIILEPAGWFLFWEGLYLTIFERRHKRPEIKFYEKAAKSEILFDSKR